MQQQENKAKGMRAAAEQQCCGHCCVQEVLCGLHGVAAWASSLSFGEEGAKEGRKDCCSSQTGRSVSDGFSASKLPQKFTME